MVDLFEINGNPLGKVPSEPTAERTDLVRAVSEVLARSRSKPLAGVILLSDGADNSGRPDFLDLARTPVPVFAVGFPTVADANTFDLAVDRPRVPERALIHNEVKIETTIIKDGGPALAAGPRCRSVTIRKRAPEPTSSQMDRGRCIACSRRR